MATSGYRGPIDATVQLKSTLEWEEEALSRASAAILIGGRRGALNIARRFMDAGKSVFPIRLPVDIPVRYFKNLRTLV